MALHKASEGQKAVFQVDRKAVSWVARSRAKALQSERLS